MNLRIIYPTDEGGVAIIVPAPDARGRVLVTDAVYDGEELMQEAVYRDETDDEFIAWVAAKDVPAGKPYKIVDVSNIPTDRTFRGAWEYKE